MKFTTTLPTPSDDALQHSQQLQYKIRDVIIENKGAISFRHYMEMALYQQGLGYYVAGARKIGKSGDFITAPEISPLFSQCLAHQCQQILAEIKEGNVLELGAGSGIMAASILLALEKQSALPQHYYILDLSPELKQRQKETIQTVAPHLLPHVIWLNKLPTTFKGVILGNEVLDAMPVDVFTVHKQQYFEHQVIWQDEQLVEQLNPAPDELSNAINELKLEAMDTPYTSEINLNLEGWFNALSTCLSQGVILLIDYGYTQREYYHPDRTKGTLICHYQHHVNESPLLYAGLQDITANVDFTAVAHSADKAGLTVSGFTSQAAFLAGNQLEHFFMRTLNASPDKQYELAQQVRLLSLPSEMGERFKVIALSKSYSTELAGFSITDQRYRL
ncbi:MAG: SAM-dependent methyltransferase [Cocleimonas sp.]|nr:SAM-dependent methyltransferase [Cocleimonas sp.]